MVIKVKDLIKEVSEALDEKRDISDTSAFVKLLFDIGQYVQVKSRLDEHPADAQYLEVSEDGDILSDWINKYSESGIQVCINAVPKEFQKKLDNIQDILSLEDSRWNDLVPELRSGLSLAATLFEGGRTFFIEADCLPSGEYIQTTADKIVVLNELLSLGIPVSYILDTGGRGPHIGIALEQSISKANFDQLIREVKKRLPPWIDTGVGRINQMERMPNTTRMNKSGRVSQVKLVYLGERVPNQELSLWVKSHPVLNSSVQDVPTVGESLWMDRIGEEEAENAAWTFIDENQLKSTKGIRSGKISITCPKAENHKSGKDKNMSAVIFVESGHVWCSSCQKTVGWTFRNRSIGEEYQSPLIPSSSEAVDLSSIVPAKIF